MIPTLALALLAAAAVPDAPLQPAGKWEVNYSDSACIAARAYANGGPDVVLAFIPAPVLGGAQLTLLRAGGYARPLQQPVEIDGPAGAVRTTLIDYPAAKGRQMISRINLTPEQYRLLATDGALRIRFAGFDRRFALVNMRGVTAELDKCVVDLDSAWTMTPERLARIRTKATPERQIRGLFSPDDYPRQALLERNTGKVGVRMMIDETGAVKDCVTTETSGSAVLDAMSCIVLRDRARFRPALDVDGHPVKSFYDQRISWRL